MFNPLASFFLNSVGLALVTLQNSQECRNVRLTYSAQGKSSVYLLLSRYDADLPSLSPQYRICTTGGDLLKPSPDFEMIDNDGGDILNKTRDKLLELFANASPVQVQIVFTNYDASTTVTEGDSVNDRHLF